MDHMAIILPFVWVLTIGFSLLMYTILDGYDLGVGLLLLTQRDHARRKEMMEIIATNWDGNETWLVLLGVAMFVGFPLAYSALLPYVYIPFFLMLVALIWRGLSLEMQSQSEAYQRGWGWSFGFGSLVATGCQGLMLGSIMDGISVTAGGVFAGQHFDFLSGFALLTAALLTCTYALSGAAWLNYRTAGRLQESARRIGRWLAPAVGLLFLAVLVAVPFASPLAASIASADRLLFVAFASILALVALGTAYYTVSKLDNLVPFLAVAAGLVMMFLGLAGTTFPYLVPPTLTFWDAAAPPSTLNFMIMLVGFCMPIIFVYNAHAYYVFRGKFAPGGEGQRDTTSAPMAHQGPSVRS
jgi:cytochrome bd ubiquinol oxidase subunit II